MSGPRECTTSRRVACTKCGAPMFEYCVNAAGERMTFGHPERVAAAKEAPELTHLRVEMLELLDKDPTRYVQPAMRQALLRLNLINPSADPRPTPKHRRCKPPKRVHTLTAAGKAALELVRKMRAESVGS